MCDCNRVCTCTHYAPTPEPPKLEVGKYYKATSPGIFSMLAVWCCDWVVPKEFWSTYGNVIAYGHYINEDCSFGRQRCLNKNELSKIVEVEAPKPLRTGKMWVSQHKETGAVFYWNQKPSPPIVEFPIVKFEDFEVEWKEIR